MAKLIGPVDSFEVGKLLVIGRESPADAVVSDPEVSKEHCAIERTEAGHVVRDLGSRNGTYVNDRRIGQRPLGFGDKLRVGRSVFVFVTDAAPPPPPSPAASPAADGTLALESRLVEPALAEPGSYLKLLYRLSILGRPETETRLVEQALSLCEETLGVPGAAAWLMRRRASVHAARGTPPDLPRSTLDDILATQRALLGGGPPRPWIAAPIRGRDGAHGVLALAGGYPFDEPDLHGIAAAAHLVGVHLEALRRESNLEEERDTLKAMLAAEEEIVAESDSMRALLEQARRVAAADSGVLLTGESGSGKEVIAREIHLAGPRAGRPFVALNCAAIPRELIESELFGHERGSFTGAHARKIGLFESARGGTLFLDEIADLKPEAQAKLLRVLEDRCVRRVGGVEDIPVDARVVAASNRPLKGEVDAGRFRPDLFFRLEVVAFAIPPLRERPRDILALARHFSARLASKMGRPVKTIPPETEKALLRYPWPGNVRELRNAVERAYLLNPSPDLRPSDLPSPDSAPAPSGAVRLDDVEREHILRTLRAARGNKKAAAALLGIDRVTLYNRLRRYGAAGKSET
jgi:DNA-binding NtrC family response regulator/pSer/pThr/pTyr-binding forkhead associated (FHA) protein